MSASTDISAVPTSGTVHLPPAPRSLEALGRHHTLEAALAELVDNSFDAGARHVLIRFVQKQGRLKQLVVVDDGRGMTDNEIDIAMTVGGERRYESGEIGRFGFGLKAASFSQADTLTVLSRTVGSHPVGRRWRLARAKQDFTCEIVDPKHAETVLRAEWELPPASTGTLVRWDDVRGFPALAEEAETQRFLQDAFGRIRTHLGVIYHRLLERKAARIFIDMEDVDEGLGQRIEVAPVDPFGHSKTGAAGWPKTLHVDSSEGPIPMHCHVWPGRSGLDEFRLDGDVMARQGLYVYYNDRLIQRGGWNDLVHVDKQLNLARAYVDTTGDVDGLWSVRPEKNGIEVGPRFARLIKSAQADDGATFAEYLEAAKEAFKESNRRRRERAARLPPGSGFDPKVRKAIQRSVPLKDEESFSIRWCPLPRDQFFEIDRDESTLWLNKRFRAVLAGGRPGSLNDLPVVKVLLYLLFEEIFAGQNIGPRDRDNLDLWHELLAAAAEAEAS